MFQITKDSKLPENTTYDAEVCDYIYDSAYGDFKVTADPDFFQTLDEYLKGYYVPNN